MLDDWLLAPVIGEVNNSQAVILLEPVNKDLPIKYQYYPEEDQIIEREIICKLNSPTRIVINFPFTDEYGPPRSYNLSWLQDNQVIYNHDIVITNDPSRLLFVSCDMLEANTEDIHCMWNHMKDRIKNGTYLIHLGDQAYMDGVFNKSLKLLKRDGPSKEAEDKIVRMYTERYYETWRPHHEILSSVPNYNIWDDHEITNNMKLDDDISLEKDYIRFLAVRAYKQCQVSQHLNLSTIITPYCWYKRLGIDNNILMLAIERTSREVHANEIVEAIKLLSDNNYTNRIILCFSGAPIPLPKGKGEFIYKGKFWSDETIISLYDGLFNWLGTNYNREIVVVGGDLHCGSYSIMSRNDRDIPVVISSPITNNPTPDRYMLTRNMSGTVRKIGNMFHNVLSSKARRCYAELDLHTCPIKVTMHYSDKRSPKSYIKYFKTLISYT